MTWSDITCYSYFISVTAPCSRAISYLSNPILSEIRTNVHAEVAFQRLLAGHKSQAASKLLAHEQTSIAQLRLVGFGHVILEDQFSSGDSRDGDGAVHDGHDNLNGC